MAKLEEVMERTKGRLFDRGIIGPEVCSNCGRNRGNHRSVGLKCPHDDNFLPPKWLDTNFQAKS